MALSILRGRRVLPFERLDAAIREAAVVLQPREVDALYALAGNLARQSEATAQDRQRGGTP